MIDFTYRRYKDCKIDVKIRKLKLLSLLVKSLAASTIQTSMKNHVKKKKKLNKKIADLSLNVNELGTINSAQNSSSKINIPLKNSDNNDQMLINEYIKQKNYLESSLRKNSPSKPYIYNVNGDDRDYLQIIFKSPIHSPSSSSTPPPSYISPTSPYTPTPKPYTPKSPTPKTLFSHEKNEKSTKSSSKSPVKKSRILINEVATRENNRVFENDIFDDSYVNNDELNEDNKACIKEINFATNLRNSIHDASNDDKDNNNTHIDDSDNYKHKNNDKHGNYNRHIDNDGIYDFNSTKNNNNNTKSCMNNTKSNSEIEKNSDVNNKIYNSNYYRNNDNTNKDSIPNIINNTNNNTNNNDNNNTTNNYKNLVRTNSSQSSISNKSASNSNKENKQKKIPIDTENLNLIYDEAYRRSVLDTPFIHILPHELGIYVHVCVHAYMQVCL
jgi:hypothetical protein